MLNLSACIYIRRVVTIDGDNYLFYFLFHANFVQFCTKCLLVFCIILTKTSLSTQTLYSIKLIKVICVS